MTGKLIELEKELDLVARWVQQRCAVDPAAVSTVTDLESCYIEWSTAENQVRMNKSRLARRGGYRHWDSNEQSSVPKPRIGVSGPSRSERQMKATCAWTIALTTSRKAISSNVNWSLIDRSHLNVCLTDNCRDNCRQNYNLSHIALPQLRVIPRPDPWSVASDRR